ncbi:MAG: ChbG/HpnK family deacetylase [Candidatus Omnitrophota bacterium]
MSKPKVRLIVNADDFGLHESVNEAIEVAHNSGILTSASLMVNGEAFEHAAQIAKKNENLGVGIHLTLNGEKPVSPAKEIFSMVNSSGKLFENHKAFCMGVLSGKIFLNHIAIECEAQIDKFLRAGLKPTHLDSHRHLHLFPPVFKALMPILKKYDIKKIRWLNLPWSDYSKMNISKIAFMLFMQYTKFFLKEKELKHPDYFIGFPRSGDIDMDYLKSVLVRLRPGATEINFHPGKDNNLIRKKYGFWAKDHNWRCDWEREFKLLLSQDIKKTIKISDISLVSYAEI